MGTSLSSKPIVVSAEEKQNLLNQKLIKTIEKYPRWLHASQKYLDKINKLLAEGANPNAENGAPFILAAQAGSKELVDTLLKKGATANVQNGKAISALVQSYIAERIYCYKIYLKGVRAKEVLENFSHREKNLLLTIDLQGSCEDAERSSHYPRYESNFDMTDAALKILQKLQYAGANINTLDHGDAPIVLAAKYCEWDLVNFFCRKQADLNIQDGTVLFHALCYGAKTNKWNIAELLLDQGAFCRIKNMAILGLFYFSINSSLMDKIIKRWVQLGVKPEEENRYCDPKSPNYSDIITKKLQDARLAQSQNIQEKANEDKASVVPFSILNSRSNNPKITTAPTPTQPTQQNR